METKVVGENAVTDLWRFALSAWRRGQVEKLCLRMQDDYQISSALLLCAGWLGASGYPPQPPLALALSETAHAWESTRLNGLRQLRRQAGMKPEWREWKRLLQEAELEAERLLLLELEVQVAEQPRGPLAGNTTDAWLRLVVPGSTSCERQSALLSELCASFSTR